jgi:hypothetical protein
MEMFQQLSSNLQRALTQLPFAIPKIAKTSDYSHYHR